MKKITTIIFIWIVTAGGLLAGEKISARLYSQVNGETLPMVNIMLEGSTIGTMTNEEGVFSLNVDHYPAKLIFSHIGFERKVLKFTFQDEFEKIYL
ncbi:MAG: carboxypeptidase-like regulatory domain-containing protein, partial [Candidatus Marinimicrobia bacterium]|nr:carboxypeptidase-like regulatory domain-containing protein [Candidatus Neomarinimicrobiota bacterium]